jgi:hypothetical protein
MAGSGFLWGGKGLVFLGSSKVSYFMVYVMVIRVRNSEEKIYSTQNSVLFGYI